MQCHCCNREILMSRLLYASAVLFVVATFASPLHAQLASELKGHVTDPAGAAIISATVHVTARATQVSQTGTTSSDGYYVFPHLLPDVYQIEVDAPGFRHATRTGVT